MKKSSKKDTTPPTIKDVAKLANVGIATVSRVLNNSDKVKEDTRQKVLQVIESLGYSPNLNARNLSSGKTSSLSLVIPDMGNPFYGNFYNKLENNFSKINYRIIVFPLINQIALKSIKYSSDMIYQTDGVIVTSLSFNNLFKDVKIHKKVILVDSYDSRFDSVYIDNTKVGGIASKYLLENSDEDTSFYMITFKEFENEFTSYVFKRRGEGFINKMKLYNKEVKVIYTDLTWNGGYEAMKKLLKRKKKGKMCIFATCDMLAFGVKAFLDEKGFEAKKDYNLIGVDDITISEVIGLTTIKQPTEQMANEVYKLFTMHLNKKNVVSNVEIAPEIVIRNT